MFISLSLEEKSLNKTIFLNQLNLDLYTREDLAEIKDKIEDKLKNGNL